MSLLRQLACESSRQTVEQLKWSKIILRLCSALLASPQLCTADGEVEERRRT